MSPQKNENTPKKQGELKNKSNINTALESVGLVSQLGFTMALPIVLGALAGKWLDDRLGTGYIFFVLLLCLGIVGGSTAAYRLIIPSKKKINKKEK